MLDFGARVFWKRAEGLSCWKLAKPVDAIVLIVGSLVSRVIAV